MDEVKNVEPKTNQTPSEDLGTLWDIDEPSFDESFGLEKEGDDPVLKGLDLPEPDVKEEPKDEAVETPLDLDLDTPEDVKEEVVEEEEVVEKPVSKSEEKEEKESDIDEIINKETQEPSVDGDNEFSVFAKMLSDKGVIDLNEEEFDSSEQGLIDAVDGTIEQRIKEEIDLFQKGLPTEGKDLLRHIMNGGNITDFVNAYDTPDITSLDISGDNFQNQRIVLKEFLRLRGDSKEEIEETLSDYEDLGKLEKQARKAKARLENYHEDRKRDLAEKTRRDSQARETQRKEVLTQITDTITDSDTIKGFPLSRKRKKELLSYMTNANVRIETPNGPQYVSQFQADEMKSSQNIDDFILKAYLRMTDYDLEGVKKKSKTDYTSSLRTHLQNKKSMTDTKANFGGNKKPGATKGSAVWDIWFFNNFLI